MSLGSRAVALLLLLSTFSFAQNSSPEFPSDAIPKERMEQYSDLAVQWLQEYLRIDTTNPPGNEARAVVFFKKILDAEGIENQVFDYAPGRSNLIAFLRGSGKQRPLILLNHTDVVSSDPERWKVPPFSGEILNGEIYGRGAIDMKGEGLVQLVVMVMLKREKVALDRDIIFLATGDEEADGLGTDWMIEHQRQLFGQAEFLINEGGENQIDAAGKMKFVGVDVAEKSPFWLRVTTKGRPGHGSRPLPNSATNRLIRALSRIATHQTELKVLPVVQEFFAGLADRQPPEHRAWFRDVRKAIRDPRFRALIQNDKDLNYLFRNTIAVTMLQGSQQTNVIPGEAWAQIDVRLLPGEKPDDFLAEMRRVVNDAEVEIKPQSTVFRIANESSTATPLFDAIRKVSARYFAGGPVVPVLTSGYTENQRFRMIDIASYGFSPFAVTAEVGTTDHGDNERIPVEQVRRAPRLLYDVVVTTSR